MSLSDVASIGSLVSGLAVLVSLLYLAQQTRQNVKHTRALIFSGSASRAVSLYLAMASPEASKVWVAENTGSTDAARIQHEQFRRMCGGFYINWDDAFWQHEEGLIDDESFERVTNGVVAMLAAPAARRYFEGVVRAVTGDFKFHNYLEQCLARASAEAAGRN